MYIISNQSGTKIEKEGEEKVQCILVFSITFSSGLMSLLLRISI